MNNKPNFKLPTTPTCIVKYMDAEGKLQDKLMDTPPNNGILISRMLSYHIGYGQIRAVKAVEASDLKTSILNNFGHNQARRRETPTDRIQKPNMAQRRPTPVEDGRLEPMFA